MHKRTEIFFLKNPERWQTPVKLSAVWSQHAAKQKQKLLDLNHDYMHSCLYRLLATAVSFAQQQCLVFARRAATEPCASDEVLSFYLQCSSLLSRQVEYDQLTKKVSYSLCLMQLHLINSGNFDGVSSSSLEYTPNQNSFIWLGISCVFNY